MDGSKAPFRQLGFTINHRYRFTPISLSRKNPISQLKFCHYSPTHFFVISCASTSGLSIIGKLYFLQNPNLFHRALALPLLHLCRNPPIHNRQSKQELLRHLLDLLLLFPSIQLLFFLPRRQAGLYFPQFFQFQIFSWHFYIIFNFFLFSNMSKTVFDIKGL